VITYGDTVSGEAIDMENPVIYAFDGIKGQQVNIVAASDEVDTYLIVVDADANERRQLSAVAARAGGTVLQIREGVSGLLYEVGNSADLASMLGRYLEDPELRRKHGSAAREFVIERHSMQHTIRELLRWYDTK
jgi:glycosyltransferase involved in cell wall biosynthesis